MTQELATRDRFDVPDRALAEHKFMAIKAFQTLVHHHMVPGKDYGVIPGTQRPTLLKPGAEKIAKLMGLSDTYVVLHEEKDWDKPFFEFQIKCVLSDGQGVVSEGLGECNSMEARYRWRQAKRKCTACGAEAIIKGKAEWGGGWLCFKKQGGCGTKFRDGDQNIEDQKTGRVPNEDIYDQVNTILKMARKRALVDAALSAGRLSDIFTQDMEDLQPVVDSSEDDGPPSQGEGSQGEGPPSDTPARTPSKPKASEAPLRSNQHASKASKGPVKGEPQGPQGISDIKSMGDLLNWAYRELGLYRKDVEAKAGVDLTMLATIEELHKAARTLQEKMVLHRVKDDVVEV